MSEKRESEIDLDEDLFDFDEVLDGASEDSSKVDLDELLRVLEDTKGATGSPTSPAQPPHARPREAAQEELAAGGGRSTSGAAPPESPAAAPAVTVAPSVSGRLARIAIAVLATIALLNVVSMGLSWERNRELSAAVLEMESRFLRAAADLRQELFHQSSTLERNRLPVVAPQAIGRAALEQVDGLLENGRYAEARRRLYSLLAIVDRYEAEDARSLEARASYLIADAWRLEAKERAAREDVP